MADLDHQKIIAYCKERIREKLGWGNSEEWKHSDYKKLSEEIYNKTRVKLSVNTLKRLWGNMPYEGQQQISTLNAIAQYTGYDDWWELKRYLGAGEPGDGKKPVPQKKKKKIIPLLILMGIIVALAGIIIWFASRKTNRPFTKKQIEKTVFHCRNPKDTIPFTGVFEFDIKPLNVENASIYFYYDINRLVHKNDSISTFNFIVPGLYTSFLKANDRIIKTEQVYAMTDGWTSVIHLQNTEKSESLILSPYSTDKHVIRITAESLKNRNIDQEYVSSVNYFNVKDFHVSADNLTIETKIKMNQYFELSAFSYVELSFICDSNFINFPVSDKGGSRLIHLFASEKVFRGGVNDLSGFTCNLHEWQKLKMSIKNRHVTYMINDKKVQTLNYRKPLNGLKGLRFKFYGLGEVDYVRIWNEEDSLVYEDQFNVKL